MKQNHAIHKRKVIIIACVMLVIATMTFIFLNSAKNADESSAQSSSFIAFVERLLGKTSLPFSEGTIRSMAHFTEYMVLGLAMGLLVAVLTWWNWKHWYFYLLGWAVCVAYALTDEWHQMFVPGRAAEWNDVFVDSAGALLGSTVIFLIVLAVRHHLEKRTRNSANP